MKVQKLKKIVASLIFGVVFGLLGTSISGVHAQAAVADIGEISGRIGNVDAESIQVKTQKGLIDVPRKMISKKADLRPGRKILVRVNLVDVLAYNIAKYGKK